MYNMYLFSSQVRVRLALGSKVYNMNLYAENAESQLLIEIQGLNNCIFGKRNQIQCGFFFRGGVVNITWFFLFRNILSTRDAELR